MKLATLCIVGTALLTGGGGVAFALTDRSEAPPPMPVAGESGPHTTLQLAALPSPPGPARASSRVTTAAARTVASPALVTSPSPTATPAVAPAPPSGPARVVVYGATGCGACRALEADLRRRGVPYTEVDADRDAARFSVGRAAAGNPRGIPFTEVDRDARQTWIHGADGERVERAYRGR